MVTQCVCVCSCVCMCVCVLARMHACVCVCARARERKQDYFIVRPPAHNSRSEHAGNLNFHGSNDRLKLSFLVFKALKTKANNEREREKTELHGLRQQLTEAGKAWSVNQAVKTWVRLSSPVECWGANTHCLCYWKSPVRALTGTAINVWICTHSFAADAPQAAGMPLDKPKEADDSADGQYIIHICRGYWLDLTEVSLTKAPI